MELTSNPKMVMIAVVGLCAVIGMMSLLTFVYYTNAANIQNQMNTEIAALTAERNDLQQQVESGDSQISILEAQVSSLNTQISSLNSQVTSLNAQVSSLNTELESLNAEKATLNQQVADLTQRNADLQLQVDGYTDLVETLASRLSQYETLTRASGRGMGVDAHAT